MTSSFNVLLDNKHALVTTDYHPNSDLGDMLTINHQNCTAKVSLYGGQVLSYQPKGHKDIFWLSEFVNYKQDRAIRGGIPICWPWFGPYDLTENQVKEPEEVKLLQTLAKKKHGFARLNTWELVEVVADEAGVTVILNLHGSNLDPLWSHRFSLTQRLFFGQCFKQSLSMTNLSEKDIKYSAALHNYFSVSNPSQVSIDSLTGVQYFDELTSQEQCQKNSVSCVGEIDRKYHSDEQMVIFDHKWQRKINVVSEQCQDWVLWNPGTTLANTMADIHPGGEHEYVCLEPANTSWQTFPAGKTITISQQISVENLSCSD